MSSLPTTIVDPEKVAWKGEASQVVLGISDGLVGILPGHTDAVFALSPQIARINETNGTEIKFFVSGGIAKVQNGILTVVADSAETPNQIDRERALKSKERAEERLAKADRTVAANEQ